ncbi:YraN family protein [Arenicella sp.]|nr:YraN family protein [Arenicella sp.]
MTLHQKNYNCRFGEIDIVMQDHNYLVFVEVRHRKSNLFGGALESVDSRKQKKLRNSAEHYLIKHKKTDSPCRFDILCVNGDLNNPEIDWIKNAF